MRLTLDADPSINLIRRYSASEIVIGERSLSRPCIVSAQTLNDHWEFKSIQCLTVDELMPILRLGPEVILLGTGERQVFPPPQLLAWCIDQRIALEPMDLGAACRTFNVLVQEGRKVVGAFVLGR